MAARASGRRLDRASRYDGGTGLVDAGDAAERLPDRADEPRDRLPLRRVPDPEEAEGRAAHRRQRATGARARPTSTRAFSENPESVAPKLTLPARPDRPDAADPARAPRRRDRAARLGPAADDRRRALGAPQHRLEGAGLHAADRRRPVRPPAARRPSGLGRRAHLRRRPADRRGRHRAVRQLPVAVRVDLRRRPGRRQELRRASRSSQPPEFAMYSYDFVHVLVAAITHARLGRPGQGAPPRSTRSRPRARTATSAASTSTATRASSTTTSTSRASTT